MKTMKVFPLKSHDLHTCTIASYTVAIATPENDINISKASGLHNKNVTISDSYIRTYVRVYE